MINIHLYLQNKSKKYYSLLILNYQENEQNSIIKFQSFENQFIYFNISSIEIGDVQFENAKFERYTVSIETADVYTYLPVELYEEFELGFVKYCKKSCYGNIVQNFSKNGGKSLCFSKFELYISCIT